MLLEFLRTHDAVCPLCDYNLRNLTVPRCPECGKEIQLAVGLVNLNYRSYITMLVALLLPAGMGCIAWIALIVNGLVFYRGPHLMAVICFVGFQLSVFPALAAILNRRRFLKLESHTQATLAALAVFEPILLYGLMICEALFQT